MTQPTDDQLAAAAQKARADHETAREIAARLLAPPDPVDILAGVIADRGEVADERDELQAKCDALSADLVAIRGIVGRHGAPIAEAVRQIRDELIRERDLARADRDTARESTREASAIAEAQRTAAADLRAALDRVATAAGVDSDSTGAIVADRVIKELREAGRAGLAVAQCRTIKDAADILFRDAVSPGAPSADRRSDLGSALLAIAAGRANKTEASPPALPADLRTYLETRRDRLQGGHGLGLAAEIAALNRWLALPTAEVTP